MSLAPGVRLGAYEVVALIGAGGMGEVYRARDTRLDRTVAVKILPETLAADPQFIERFDREARAISQLTHPHICTLYDVGQEGGTHFLVMEYLQGESLADKLAKGRLPLDQALRCAIEIADALDRAHRAGIIHRDLKPGNIMLTKGGAKLLDFGLAKTGASVVGGTGLSMLPTTPPHLTAQGEILGTVQYMAPEQLEGQDADSRTDIFAFGAVFYEMLTGKKAFEAKSHASLIGAILKDDPLPISDAQPLASTILDHIVKKCLAKDRDNRWQSAHDLQSELQWVRQHLSQETASATSSRPMKSRARLSWLAAIAAVVAASGATFLFRAGPPQAPEMRLQIVTPDASGRFALSPDGRRLVFAASGRLWLRSLDAEAAKPLTGTEGGDRPFWSPDGRSVAFFADGKLKRLEVAGGPLQTLTDIQSPNSSATWNADGVILLGGSSLPIERVAAAGGSREAVTSVGAGQVDHRHPQFLPDGQHFLFFATGTPEARGVYVGSLGSKDTRRVLEADAWGVFLPPDYALFIRQQTLFAQRLDLQRFEPIGERFPVAESVEFGAYGGAVVSSSASGLLAYRSAPTTRSMLLTWFDRTGKRVGTVGEPDPNVASGTGFRLSPNGGDVAFARTVGGNTDIWLVDLTRSVRSRFTVDSGGEDLLIWSPDGSRLVFHSNRTGRYDLYLKPVTGDAPEILLLESSQNKNPSDWSSDGRFILYESMSPKTGIDLWMVPVAADRRPVPVVRTPFAENQGRFSPDNRWIAYRSDASGRQEIVLKRLSGTGRETQVSTGGGSSVRWRGDGRELLYRAPENRVMAVAVTLPAEGTNVQLGVPVSLFTLPPGSDWDVTPDGQRFLLNVPSDGAAVQQPITVVVNWHPPGRTK